MNAQENSKSTMKNILAIAAFVLLLLVGIWSAIQVVKFVPRLFSDTGTVEQTSNNNGIVLGDRDIAAELSTDTAQSGEPVTIAWAYNGGTDGVLSFSYACKEGFYFQIAGRPVPCNAPYNLSGVVDSTLEIIPLSAKERVEAPLAITYTNAQGESVRDTKTLTVLNQSVVEEEPAEETTGGPVEPETQKPMVTQKPTTPTRVVQTILVPRTSNPYGTADLKVEVVAVGEVNQYGAFEAKNLVHQYSRGAVKFNVTNLGDKETGNWYFSAILPSQGGYPFSSQMQPSLMPGSSIEIFMTFDQLAPGTREISIHVDPYNNIRELNDYNNFASQFITVLHY